MSDYSPMSAFYDLIMTSGYYDYDAIANSLASFGEARTVLELGVGTGLVLEKLSQRRPDMEIIGVDMTPAMLQLAKARLEQYPNVSVYLQNVLGLSLGRTFDMTFSYGGVWYFSRTSEGLALVSHIRDDTSNWLALRRVVSHMPIGGALLLGVQGPHENYSKTLHPSGFIYSQSIRTIPQGFSKHYALANRRGETVMSQHTEYRTYPYEEAIERLRKCRLVPKGGAGMLLFKEFRKR